MTDPPKTREEAYARLDAKFLPFFIRILETEPGNFTIDDKAWHFFIDYLTGPFMHRLLYEEAKPAYCIACENEGAAGRFDEYHVYSPNGRLCHCDHPEGSHSKGEKGENSPFYKYFEMLTRGKKPVPGMGPIPPLYNMDLILPFFQVLMDSDKLVRPVRAFYGVKEGGPPALTDGAP